VTIRGEFHGSCIDPARNGEASYKENQWRLPPYILSHRQATNFFTRMGIPDPSSKAYKQRRGTYFYYNRAAIGLACAQAIAMRIDITPHKRPRKKHTRNVPNPHYLHIPPHANLHRDY
jgi:hypothetical protein